MFGKYNKLNYYLLGKWLLRDALVDAAAGESDREKTQTGHSKCEQKTYHLYIHYVQISSINNQTNLPSFIQPWGGRGTPTWSGSSRTLRSRLTEQERAAHAYRSTPSAPSSL